MKTPTISCLLALAFSSPALSFAQDTPCGELLDIGQQTAGGQVMIRSVSGDGSTVVGSAITPNGVKAVRWTEPVGYELLGDLPGADESAANAVSHDGSVIVGAAYDNQASALRPFRWSGAGMQELPLVAGLGAGRGSARRVSEDGMITAGETFVEVGVFGDEYEVALVWSGTGAPTIVVPPGAGFSRLLALSGDGSTVAGVAFGVDFDSFGSPFLVNQQAFVWSSASGYGLIGSVDDATQPVDLSYDGSVALVRRASLGDSALWTRTGGFQPIPIPRVSDLSADGTVAVGTGSQGGDFRPYRWSATSGGEFLGGPPGGRATGAFLSADGRVVAGETRTQSNERAVFRWTVDGGWEDIGTGLFSDPFEPSSMSDDGRVIVGETRFSPHRGLVWRANGIGDRFCRSVVNSVGQLATIQACGCDEVSANELTLLASRVPPNTFGIVVTSRTQSAPNPVAGSVGQLCLAGSVGRFVDPGQILDSGPAGSDGTGTFVLPVDLTRLPSGPGFVAAQPGETWNFQAWYRDTGALTGPSNLTDAVGVTLR